MSKFLKEHFIHFVLYVLEAAFMYLHKYYDIYYNFYCEKFELRDKEGDVLDEKSGF